MVKYFILFAVGIFLLATNPSPQDFSFFLRDQAQSRLDLKDPTAKMLAGEFLATAAIEASYRKNFFIASKYTIDTIGLSLFAPNLPVKFEFLGVAGKFIPLSDFP